VNRSRLFRFEVFKHCIPHSKANRELVEDYVEQMTLEQLNGAMLFFSTLLNELSNTSLDYLETEVKKLTEELTEQLRTETT